MTDQPKLVIPAHAGNQYTAAYRSIATASGILDHPLEPVIGQRFALTRWRMMTAVVEARLSLYLLTLKKSFSSVAASVSPTEE